MVLKSPKRENREDDYFWNTYVTPTVFNRDKNKCVKCGAPAELVHHNSYDPDITINDLSSLCKRCHQKLHKRDDYDVKEYDTNWDNWDDL